jgi:microcystin-dependent protein
MACGCTSACGCDVIGDDVTAAVVRVGDTFTVSSIHPILDVADTDCIELDIDGSKILTASLILAPGTSDGGMQLECTPDGLEANIEVDPASTAIVSVSDQGLRVDAPPPPPGDGTGMPGDLIFHGGVGIRANCIDADGSAVPRAGYPALHDALSLYATAASRVAAGTAIMGIPSTRFIAPGMVVEATGFGGVVTVVSVDSSSQITVSSPSVDSGSDTEVRVYPHGNGDGLTTFNVPDGSRRFPLGYDYVAGLEPIGTLDGDEDVTLTGAQIPSHTHPITDPLHDHGASSVDAGHNHGGLTGAEGSHDHTPGTATRNFVTAEAGPGPGFAISNVTVDDAAGGTDYSIVVDNGGTQQRNNHVTSFEPDHTHAIPNGNAAITTTVAMDSTGITATDANIGGGGAHNNMPPHLIGRWVVHT